MGKSTNLSISMRKTPDKKKLLATKKANSASNKNLITIPAIPPKKSKMIDIPEIMDSILSHLEVKDLKPSRLVCRYWLKTAARHLFPSFFILRPDRKDLERLEAIIRDPIFKYQINSLRFEVGNVETIDMWYWMSPKYLSRFVDARRIYHPHHWIQLVEENKDRAIAEFGRWKTRCLNANQNYTMSLRLSRILRSPKLLKLKTIEIVRRSTQFKHRYLQEAWIGRKHGYHVEIAIQEFWSLLVALKSSRVRLRKFTHDQLPLAFFYIPQYFQLNLFKRLKYLKTLHLSLDTLEPPSLAFWTGLSQFLLSCPLLEDIQLAFTSPNMTHRQRGVWCHDQAHDIKSWYVSLQKLFNGHSWVKLSRLRLDGMVISEIHLVEFARQHSEILKFVEISNMALWQGSFKSLLSSLGDMVDLKTFHIWGQLYSCHPPEAENWGLRPTHNIIPESLTPELSAYMSGNSRMKFDITPGQDLGNDLEAFVLSGGSWPMAGTSFSERPPHTSRCGERCPDLEFADRWETEWDRSDHVLIR